MDDSFPRDAHDIGPAEVAACLRVLAALEQSPEAVPQRAVVETYLARVARVARKRRRSASGSAAGESLSGSNPKLPPARRRCYICKGPYVEHHSFYAALCRPCGDLNWHRRSARTELRGRRALVTGARVKIGQALTLKLLRDGAEVHVTTRFAEDALSRFGAERDAAQWRARLHVHSLDLRDVVAVEEFAQALGRSLPALDIVVHNAAQTNRWPPPGFDLLSAGARARALEFASEVVAGFNTGAAALNSWVARLEQVPLVELIEVLMVNAAAPAILTGRLRPLLERSTFSDRYMLMVVGTDGRFDAPAKTINHPHVNMSKAALNMLTRTCAADFARTGIHLSSVDPGWVSLEVPEQSRRRREAAGETPPLDEIDGAARIYDLIIRGIAGAPVSGGLWKDYRPATW